MASWWRERDFLPGGVEQVLTSGLSADAAAAKILKDAGLDRQSA